MVGAWQWLAARAVPPQQRDEEGPSTPGARPGGSRVAEAVGYSRGREGKSSFCSWQRVGFPELRVPFPTAVLLLLALR